MKSKCADWLVWPQISEEQHVGRDRADIEGTEDARILKQDAPGTEAHRQTQLLRGLGQHANGE